MIFCTLENTTVGYFIVACVAICFLCIFILAVIASSTEKRQGVPQKKKTPVLCVCRVDDRVGVVLWEDLKRSADAYWEKHNGFAGSLTNLISNVLNPGNGRWISVDKVFVFKSDSPDLLELVSRCCVQAAIFEVPEDVVEIGDSWEYFFEEPRPKNVV